MQLRINGAEITVQERGSGAPMLLLHGSPDTGAMWLPVVERIQHRVRAIMPDMPGFGQSTLPDSFALTLDNMADFMRDLIAALGINEPVLIAGSDFGPHYGLAFTVKYPELVRGVVISNTSFTRDYRWHPFAQLYRVPLLGELLLAGTPRKMLAKTLKNYSPALPDDYIDQSYAPGFGSGKVRKTILRMYRERDPQRDFAGWDDKLRALLKEKPSLVLWGDRDPFVDPRFAESFGARDVVHFPDYGHWLPLEAPDKYTKEVLAWLDKLPVAAPETERAAI